MASWKFVVAVVVAAVAATGFFAGAASADDQPTVGTTYETLCTFVPQGSINITGPDAKNYGGAITHCNELATIIGDAGCDPNGEHTNGVPAHGYTLNYHVIVNDYQGNVVLPSLDGVTVDEPLTDVVRPHAKLLASVFRGVVGTMIFVPDETCAA